MKLKKVLAYFDPKEAKSEKAKYLLWAMNILAIPVWSCGLTALSLYLGTSKYKWELFNSYFSQPLIFALNMLPVLLLVTALLLLTNRFWLSVLASSVVVLIPSAVNYFKLLFRNEPLLVSDWVLYSEAMDMGKKYSVGLTLAISVSIAACLFSAVLAFFVLRARFGKFPLRAAGLALTAVLGIALYNTLYSSESVHEGIDNIMPDSGMSLWSFTDQYISRGFLYPLIFSATYDDGKPEGYNRETARDMLMAYPYDDIPEDKKVSIIAVMLESFSDLSKYGCFEFTENPYAFLHELYSESLHGEIVVDVFAGDTIKTELCFLTGNTMHYTYSSGAGSYVRYLSEQGYFTEYSHPCYDWFYNRINVCGYMGFDNAYFYENRYGWDGYIIEDSQYFPDLITLYQEAAEMGRPYFHFGVTYQNHGPYPDTELDGGEYIADIGYSEEAYIILNNYFDGMKRTNEALRELFDYFRGEDGPVIIVIFGDHNPWLGHSSFVYDELEANFGVNFNLNSEEGFYDYYSTPYCIWANDSAKEALGKDFTGQGGSFSAGFLMEEVFEQAGWGGDEFMKASAEFRKTIDIVHANGIVRKDGALQYRISEDTAEMIERMNAIQYYRYRDMPLAGGSNG